MRERKNIQVEFISLIMGSGKTTVTIKEFNRLKDEKFLYVTPYLDEVDRIKKECVNFVSPSDTYGTKSMNLDALVSSGKRIATTHQLFTKLNKEDYSMFSDYTLVLDEVIAGVEPVGVSKSEVDRFIRDAGKGETIIINDDNSIEWIDDDYDGEFNDFKDDVKKGGVILVNNSAFVKEFPFHIFESFKKTSILTFFAEASTLFHYFLCKGVLPKIIFQHPSTEALRIAEFKKLITVYQGKHNFTSKGAKKGFALSKGWYTKATNDQLLNIENKCRSFFYHIKTPKEFNLFSTFKDYENRINTQRKLPEHLAITTRSTNEFKNNIALSYTVNRYISPVIKNYFIQKGVDFNEDLWSLSELLQVVWRLRIREGKQIYLHIPSKRMRDLFTNWLDGKQFKKT